MKSMYHKQKSMYYKLQTQNYMDDDEDDSSDGEAIHTRKMTMMKM